MVEEQVAENRGRGAPLKRQGPLHVYTLRTLRINANRIRAVADHLDMPINTFMDQAVMERVERVEAIMKGLASAKDQSKD